MVMTAALFLKGENDEHLHVLHARHLGCLATIMRLYRYKNLELKWVRWTCLRETCAKDWLEKKKQNSRNNGHDCSFIFKSENDEHLHVLHARHLGCLATIMRLYRYKNLELKWVRWTCSRETCAKDLLEK